MPAPPSHAGVTRLTSNGVAIPSGYGDVQRFPLSDGTSYGPLASIAPTNVSSEQHNEKKWWKDGRNYSLVAIVTLSGSQAEQDDFTNNAAKYARYTDLKLGWGNNCVYLAPTNSGATAWTAKILPPDRSTNMCTPPAAGPGTLDVKPFKISQAKREDTPNVARFDEAANDAGMTTGQPLVGVKCFDQWCEIGRPGFAVRDPAAGNAYGNVKEGKIKGWHDEQMLTLWHNGTPTMTSHRASVTPDADLDERGRGYYDGTPKQVARIFVVDGVAANDFYATNMGLHQGTNSLLLKADLQTDGTRVWHASINGVDLHVEYEAHNEMFTPGTARFLLNPTRLPFAKARSKTAAGVLALGDFLQDSSRAGGDDDWGDGVWVPCDLGCCKVDSF